MTVSMPSPVLPRWHGGWLWFPRRTLSPFPPPLVLVVHLCLLKHQCLLIDYFSAKSRVSTAEMHISETVVRLILQLLFLGR